MALARFTNVHCTLAARSFTSTFPLYPRVIQRADNGSEKGAFSGAKTEKHVLFEAAHAGAVSRMQSKNPIMNN